MVKTLHLTNFKSHACTVLDLERLTVLVGPNGCGKTSALAALHYVSQLPRRAFSAVFSGPRHPDHLVRSGFREFAIHLAGEDWTFGVNVESRDTDAGETWHDIVTSQVGTAAIERPGSKIEDEQGYPTTHTEVRRAISSAVFLHFDAARLAQPAVMAMQPRVEFDGSGLAAVIADLRLADDERLGRIVKDLRGIVPSFQQLRAQPAQVRDAAGRGQTGLELVFDFIGAPSVPAHAVSEGTLIALGLLTKLHSPRPPRIILLDDIEQALHPHAQRELVAVIRRMLTRRPELQVVATAHSPYLVDELRPEEVWVMALDDKGVTRTRRLSDHPEAERALEVLRTGEFLSAEGEDWVLRTADG